MPSTPPGQRSRQPGQHRSIHRIERWSIDLASGDRKLVMQGHDLDREVRISASNEPDELGMR
ncbi:MAG TPA: hypothetical protein VKU92_10825 [Acidimicrobiales bacterium]|nr:hypothetical protein [Acidimicrobiales bacterium]